MQPTAQAVGKVGIGKAPAGRKISSHAHSLALVVVFVATKEFFQRPASLLGDLKSERLTAEIPVVVLSSGSRGFILFLVTSHLYARFPFSPRI